MAVFMKKKVGPLRVKKSTLNRGIKRTHTNYSTFHTI